MWGNGTDVGLQKENPTIAELLKPLGYATGQFGKNRLGDLNKYLPTVHGFDEFYGNLTISMPRRSLRIRARGSQEAGCRSRGVEFAPASPLEAARFEPSVPPYAKTKHAQLTEVVALIIKPTIAHPTSRAAGITAQPRHTGRYGNSGVPRSHSCAERVGCAQPSIEVVDMPQ
jgi:hypothetical protein